MPSYEELVAHMDGVEGRPYNPENWTDTSESYIWVTPDWVESVSGEHMLCSFRLKEDGTLSIFGYNPSPNVMK